MYILDRLAQNFLKIGFILSGFHTCKRFYFITIFVRGIWVCWLSFAIFIMFYWRLSGGDTSIGGLVGTALFVSNLLANLLLLLETICKNNKFKKMLVLQDQVDSLILQYLDIDVNRELPKARLMMKLLIILLIEILCDIVRTYINEDDLVNPVFYYAFPHMWGLRFRYMQIIILIMELNQRVEIVRKCLKKLAKLNAPKKKFSIDIWRPFTDWEYEQLNVLRFIYCRLYETYNAMGECFGWGLLLLFMTTFFDIVCNAYWSYYAANRRQSYHKFIFNAGSTLSLITLVVALFYYMDDSENKFSCSVSECDHKMAVKVSLRMRIEANIGRSSVWKTLISKISFFILYSGLYIFALTPIFKRKYLSYIFTILWMLEVFSMAWYAYAYDVFGDGFSLNSLISMILFVAQIGAHLTILISSVGMKKNLADIKQRFIAIEKVLANTFDLTSDNVSKIKYQVSFNILAVTLPLIVCHSIISWTITKQKDSSTMFYWRSLPTTIAIQFKVLEILACVSGASCFLKVLRNNLNMIGERNLENLFRICSFADRKQMRNSKFLKVAPINVDAEDEERLVLMKRVYGDLFALIKVINESFGGPILAFTLTFFIDFVSNTYYILLSVITTDANIYSFIQNGGFVAMALIVLYAFCWNCQICENDSRRIGTLICKLVKPLGNQRYNDLVSEFSLQTLHQHFVITAKDFFALNLNLLGSMVASIVTYLVILIQFMFAEKSNKERAAKALETNALGTTLTPLVATTRN